MFQDQFLYPFHEKCHLSQSNAFICDSCQVSTWFFTTFSVSGLKEKVHHIENLQQLFTCILPEEIDIPPFVLEYDTRVNSPYYTAQSSGLWWCQINPELTSLTGPATFHRANTQQTTPTLMWTRWTLTKVHLCHSWWAGFSVMVRDSWSIMLYKHILLKPAELNQTQMSLKEPSAWPKLFLDEVCLCGVWMMRLNLTNILNQCFVPMWNTCTSVCVNNGWK